MAAEQEYGIEELTGFAMDIIHGVGEKALAFYGKGSIRPVSTKTL